MTTLNYTKLPNHFFETRMISLFLTIDVVNHEIHYIYVEALMITCICVLFTKEFTKINKRVITIRNGLIECERVCTRYHCE